MTRAAFEQIKFLAEKVASVPGHFAEIGVWRGDTFVPMAKFAALHKRKCVAIDSFEGMDQPTERDRDEHGILQYQKGCLNGGVEASDRVAAEPNAIVFKGFVPNVFFQIHLNPFAFVHLDVDQYAPTMAALDWIWPRLADGGILVAHDWLPSSKILAAAAIDEWSAKNGLRFNGPLASSHAWIQKGATA